MVQTLKRVYLYIAATFALLFTAGVTIALLDTLLRLAGMLPYVVNFDGTIGTPELAPDSQQVTQSVVLFSVAAVLVGALFGGGHYWLIRRDARSDPGADGGPTRQVFLNGLMALAALVGVPTGLEFLGGIDQTPGLHDQAISLSFVLVAALVFVFVFLERRRANPAGRAAPIIRQIQEDGVQAILLIIASVFFAAAITAVIHYALVNNNMVAPLDCNTFGPRFVGSCAPLPLLSPILMALFAIAAWGLYVWLGAWSQGAVLQRVLRYAALGYGVLWLLYGISAAIYVAVAPLFGDSNTWQESLNSALPFVGTLLTGVLIASPYALWIRRMAARMPQRQEAIAQGLLAVPAALSAAFFLAGVIQLLGGLVERMVPAGSPPDADGWATAVGTLVAGVMYPFLWLWLRRVSDPARGGPTIPRRVYVLALLAGTAIGALIAAVFMVYQIVASVLGLVSADPRSARQSAVILLVLGVTALYHLLRLRGDLRLIRLRGVAAQPASVPVLVGVGAAAAAPAAGITSPLPETVSGDEETLVDVAGAGRDGQETLENILQEVAAGALDPATAAARIRRLPAV